MDDNDKQLLEQLYEDAEIIILNKQGKNGIIMNNE